MKNVIISNITNAYRRKVQKSSLVAFALGLFSGIILSHFVVQMAGNRFNTVKDGLVQAANRTETGNLPVEQNANTREPDYKDVTFEPIPEEQDTSGKDEDKVVKIPNDVVAMNPNDVVANRPEKEVRVLCWVMTSPENHVTKASHVKATWGKRCNVLLFMSTAADANLTGTVKLNITEGYSHLWGKTKAAFTYVHNNHREDADWFLKTDDDTYVVMENLRHMLSEYNTSDPIYFGCKFKPFVTQGYMSGGAGYVLSKRALDLFISEGLKNNSNCSVINDAPEDVGVGHCMEEAGVTAGDSRDRQGRGRFFPLAPDVHLAPENSRGGASHRANWFPQYTFYESKQGFECCSDSVISFHYVEPMMMYVMEYFIYVVRPYGLAPACVASSKNTSETL